MADHGINVVYTRVDDTPYEKAVMANNSGTATGIEFLVYEDGLYKVRVGAFLSMDEAVEMERRLRGYGYHTFITRS